MELFAKSISCFVRHNILPRVKQGAQDQAAYVSAREKSSRKRQTFMRSVKGAM
jgi:hypothetical protein